MATNTALSQDGRRLTFLLCSLELPLMPSGDKKNILESSILKSYLNSHKKSISVMKDYSGVIVETPSFSIDHLQRDIRTTLRNDMLTFDSPEWLFFLVNNAPFWCILSRSSCDSRVIHSVVRLPDLVANTFQGVLPNNILFGDLLKSLTFNLLLSMSFHANASRRGLVLSKNSLLSYLESFILNNSVYTECMSEFIQGLDILSKETSFQTLLAKLIEEMTMHQKTEFLAQVFNHVKTGNDALKMLRMLKFEDHRTLLSNLLLSKSKLGETASMTNFVCFLSNALSQELYVSTVLLPILKIWADPIVAKGYVKSEVLHYSRSIVAIISHVQEVSLAQYKMKIVEMIAKGLPNHLSSTDPRTVILAKFICDFLTQTMQLYEKQVEKISEDVCNPTDPICVEAIQGFHTCPITRSFWMSKCKTGGANHKLSEEESKTGTTDPHSDLNSDDDDDVDDDNLVPIETNEPLYANKLVYIRDFLEGLPESKTYDDVKNLFSNLPKVVCNQIAYEHPQLGRDLLDSVFFWENDFGCTDLDELKKVSLSVTLETKMDGNVDHFCTYFNRKSLQSLKKNLVLDVLTRVSEKVNLKDLNTLAKVVFRVILSDADAIQKQDTINKIPMIMFFQKLICSLPSEMVTEGMVMSYLRAISCIQDPDSGIKQTVQYALYKVIDTLQGKPLTQDVRQYVIETRHWWGQLG